MTWRAPIVTYKLDFTGDFRDLQFDDHPVLVTLLAAPLGLPTITHILTCTYIISK